MADTAFSGYSWLSTKEQTAYNVFLEAFRRHADSVDSRRIPRGVDCFKVIGTVVGDWPEFVYFDKSRLVLPAGLLGGPIRLAGVHGRAAAAQMAREMEQKVQQVLAQVDHSRPEKALLGIQEYLMDTVSYHHRAAKTRLLPGLHQNAHNAYGALVEGQAVCDGIAAAVCLLAKRLGIGAMMVTGVSGQPDIRPQAHAWNIVQLGDECCHMDVTWDVNRSETLGAHCYDYFCVTDDDMVQDHQWNMMTTPPCRGKGLDYFSQMGLLARGRDRLLGIFEAALRARRPVVRVKLGQNITLAAPQDDYIAGLLLDEAQRLGVGLDISYSYSEVTRCFAARVEYR